MLKVVRLGGGGAAGVTSVNGQTGVVVLGPNDVGATANTTYVLTSGLLSGGGQLNGNVTVSMTSVPSANVTGTVANSVVYTDGSNVFTTGTVLTFNGTTLTNNGNAIISDNSSNAALRITQTGAGNALLVEDSANPDSTPFVIDAIGKAIIGTTTAISTVAITASITPNFQQHGTTLNTSSVGLFSWGSNPYYTFNKAGAGGVGTYTTVASGDVLGRIQFNGADGTNFICGATISSEVDGTPGTNDMPGRLVFSTTADGAASPTERMRIDNAGQVGIGGTPISGQSFNVSKSITGSTDSMGIRSTGTVQSGVTSSARAFDASFATAATAFTLSNAVHYYANGITVGAGSTVTNQYGFQVTSNLTGATNNYGFLGEIASGTGRWNLYMGGTASNYLAGDLRIGTTTNTNSSKIVAAGVIESTSGGFKFPDGTTQTSAGTSSGKAIAFAMILGG